MRPLQSAGNPADIFKTHPWEECEALAIIFVRRGTTVFWEGDAVLISSTNVPTCVFKLLIWWLMLMEM